MRPVADVEAAARPNVYPLVAILLIAYPFVLLVLGAVLCLWSGWLALP